MGTLARNRLIEYAPKIYFIIIYHEKYIFSVDTNSPIIIPIEGISTR